MKKYLISLFMVLASLQASAQNDGSSLWLGKASANACQVTTSAEENATVKIARQELENSWRGKNVNKSIDDDI